MNPEIVRLIREEGATVHLSGDRSGFSAGLNTRNEANPLWLIEASGNTPEAALTALLEDPTVQPEAAQ